MKKVSTLTSASITLLTVAAMTAPAYAWHPQGTVIKEVQNQAAGSAISDANDVSAAVSAAPGDTLIYTVTISNTGAAASNGNNDMAGTKLTDTLPTGVALVSNSAQRTISEGLGTIVPGKSVTKTYAVKVTDTTDGDVITNRACFTGNSKVNDNPQSGCDVAVVKVKVPPVTLTPPVTPPVLPLTLPNTGSTSFSAAALVLIGLIAGYAVNTLRLKRHANS